MYLRRHTKKSGGVIYETWTLVETVQTIRGPRQRIVTTVEDIIGVMGERYGKARRVWVMDRGMVSEENLEILRERDAHYIVGTPTAWLRKFERELPGAGWEEAQLGVEVKFAPSPEGTNETFLLCRSQGRQEKEQAILNRFITRIEAGLGKLREQAETGRLRDKEKALLRIGRLLERNRRAASLFDVTVEERQTENGPRLAVTIKKVEAAFAESTEDHRKCSAEFGRFLSATY